MTPPENHEKTTFRAFLETKGPRDPPWMQERQILFRIALTRALYDQTAPQLCLFYIPGLVKNPGWSKIRAGQKSRLVKNLCKFNRGKKAGAARAGKLFQNFGPN